MGRPTKKGIDFFPVDTTFDDKVELFVAENGAESLSVLITTWQLIYSGQGYYVNFTDDLLLLIRRRLILDVSRIKEILEAAVRREIFSPEHLQRYGIMTSRAIQANYLIASRKKKTVTLVKDYLCNGVSDAGSSNITWVSDAGNTITTENNGISDAGKSTKAECSGISTAGNAIKEEEEEEEEKNILYSRREEFRTKRGRSLKGELLDSFNAFWAAFNYKKGKAEAADAWIEVYTHEVAPLIIEGAIREAAARSTLISQGRSPKWAQGWLSGRRWEDESYQQKQSEEEQWY